MSKSESFQDVSLKVNVYQDNSVGNFVKELSSILFDGFIKYKSVMFNIKMNIELE